MSAPPQTVHIPLTRGHRDLLLVMADAMERDVTISPHLVVDAVAACRDLAAGFDEKVAEDRRIDELADAMVAEAEAS